MAKKKPWTRNEKIAAWGTLVIPLVVLIVGLFSSEFRGVLHLEKAQPSPVTAVQTQVLKPEQPAIVPPIIATPSPTKRIRHSNSVHAAKPTEQSQPTYSVTNPTDSIINQNSPNFGQQTIVHNPPVNPNRRVVVYDCIGSWKSSGPGEHAAMEIATCLPDKCEKIEVFNEMVALNNTALNAPDAASRTTKCMELQTKCEREIKATPEWITPWLFCGAAELCLGDLAKLRASLKYYDEHAGPTYNTDQCKDASTFLHGQLTARQPSDPQ